MQESAFWNFSLRLYARPGVPEACLQLQDECGVDVNVMLYTLYLARSGRAIGTEDVARIEALVEAWRNNVVRPLRQARRFMKQPPSSFDDASTASLRTEVKRIELESERLQQLALERNLPAERLGTPLDDLAACARGNLAAYAQRMGPFRDEPIELLLRRVHDV